MQKTKVCWLMFADYMIKQVFQHAQSCFTMSFCRSFWWDLARASPCRFQPKKRNGGPLATSNLWKITTEISGQRTCFNSSGETDLFLPGKHRFFGCLGKNQETSCKKSAQFSYKTFRSLGLLNERTLNSFPKILLLADMGINLGFLGVLLVLIPSEVWGVNMDRWIFRPPHALFVFPMATGDPDVFFGWYGGGGWSQPPSRMGFFRCWGGPIFGPPLVLVG